MELNANVIRNSFSFKRVSKEQWDIFNGVHKELYGEDCRHFNIRDDEERLFLRTKQKRVDGLIDLVATRVKSTLTGDIRYTVREDVEEDFLKFCKHFEQ